MKSQYMMMIFLPILAAGHPAYIHVWSRLQTTIICPF